jgi:hypothetical protein
MSDKHPRGSISPFVLAPTKVKCDLLKSSFFRCCGPNKNPPGGNQNPPRGPLKVGARSKIFFFPSRIFYSENIRSFAVPSKNSPSLDFLPLATSSRARLLNPTPDFRGTGALKKGQDQALRCVLGPILPLLGFRLLPCRRSSTTQRLLLGHCPATKRPLLTKAL